MSSNWMGCSFSGTPDEKASSGYQLLQEGIYKAKITDIAIGKTAKNLDQLNVYFQLEDKTIIKEAFVLPDKTVDPDHFSRKMLRNLFSRVLYSSLTYNQFKQLSNDEVTKACESINHLNIKGKFIGVDLSIEIEQKPVISKHKDGKIKFTSLPFSIKDSANDKIKNIFKQSTFERFPELVFFHGIKALSIGFLKGFIDREKRDSVSKTWYDNNIKTNIDSSNDSDRIGEDELPF